MQAGRSQTLARGAEAVLHELRARSRGGAGSQGSFAVACRDHPAGVMTSIVGTDAKKNTGAAVEHSFSNRAVCSRISEQTEACFYCGAYSGRSSAEVH